MFVLKIIYWICVFLLVYTYLIYPLIIKLLHRLYTPNQVFYLANEPLPTVAILMAAYNEEEVIAQKIDSVLQSAVACPNAKVNFYIGSDNSSDATNSIVENYASQHANLKFYPFKTRQGKQSIINQLAADAKKSFGEHIIIITDASVMFSESTIYEIIKHFKNQDIAIVESNIVGTGLNKAGISKIETKYVSGEILYKYYEGKIFEVISGPMGGCYAIRASYFSPVPPNFMVDDFFITMTALGKGGKAIVEPKAICYEGISQQLNEEIRRKTRIGTGNYQNLVHFSRLWLKFPFTKLSIVLFSHKILRWIGPMLILGSTLSLLPLATNNLMYSLLLLWHLTLIFIIPLIYIFLEKKQIHISILRTVTYFFAANYALLKGFFNFLKGVNSGIWEPTKRNN